MFTREQLKSIREQYKRSHKPGSAIPLVRIWEVRYRRIVDLVRPGGSRVDPNPPPKRLQHWPCALRITEGVSNVNTSALIASNTCVSPDAPTLRRSPGAVSANRLSTGRSMSPANACISRSTSASFERNMKRLAPGNSTIRAVGTAARRSCCHLVYMVRVAAYCWRSAARSCSLRITKSAAASSNGRWAW
jgi:hypothetical protein